MKIVGGPFILGVALVVAAGVWTWADIEAREKEPPPPVPDGVVAQHLLTGSWRVIEFVLKDGTRCVAAYRGGLTCDWRRP